jgi:hypothetical protein
MKILLKDNKVPKVGDKRNKTRFAFIPTVVCSGFHENRYLIWWCNYFIKQEYKMVEIVDIKNKITIKNDWATIKKYC